MRHYDHAHTTLSQRHLLTVTFAQATFAHKEISSDKHFHISASVNIRLPEVRLCHIGNYNVDNDISKYFLIYR
jgi:hypothetical protein